MVSFPNLWVGLLIPIKLNRKKFPRHSHRPIISDLDKLSLRFYFEVILDCIRVTFRTKTHNSSNTKITLTFAIAYIFRKKSQHFILLHHCWEYTWRAFIQHAIGDFCIFIFIDKLGNNTCSEFMCVIAVLRGSHFTAFLPVLWLSCSFHCPLFCDVPWALEKVDLHFMKQPFAGLEWELNMIKKHFMYIWNFLQIKKLMLRELFIYSHDTFSSSFSLFLLLSSLSLCLSLFPCLCLSMFLCLFLFFSFSHIHIHTVR